MYLLLKEKGFSLIELAMVLFIISLILGGLLPPLATQIEQREREITQDQLDEIKQIMYGFAFSNSRLPCPDCRLAGEGACLAADVDDGVEDPDGSGDCKTEIGNLPWSTLGIKDTDAWDQLFTYRVTESFADTTDGAGGCTPVTAGVSFSLCSDGDIDIFGNDADAEIGTANFIAENVPAIVISHGANYHETPSDDEEENYDDPANADDESRRFVYHDFVADDANAYDDMIIWISPHILRTKMLDAGILP